MSDARFEVLKSVAMSISIFWDTRKRPYSPSKTNASEVMRSSETFSTVYTALYPGTWNCLVSLILLTNPT